MKTHRYEMDMTNGPILKKMIVFCIPVLLSGLLQIFYNAADVVVVGRYAGQQALAAVGSTGSITNLLVSLFLGLSVGVSVVTSQYYGAKEEKNVSETVHTSITVSLLGGIILAVVGFTFARTFLLWMDTPADVIDLSTKYMKICMLGMPAMLLYNFASAILRAIGDTKRPLYFLTISGITNVVMNLFFVIVCGMDVDGVALATIISQYLSAVLVVICLMKSDGCYRLVWKQLCITPQKLGKIARIGLPAGLQSALFNVSNVMIQSSVNSFGSAVMAGNTAAANIENFIYTAMNSVYQGAVTFAGQNVGAKKPERLNRILLVCVCMTSAIGASMGVLFTVFGRPLLGIYNSDPEIISSGLIRLSTIFCLYAIGGIMDVFSGMLRGMGCAIAPFSVSILGVCGVRIVWLLTVFAQFRTLEMLYLSYPVTWVVTASCHCICYIFLKKKLTPRLIAEREASEAKI